MEKVLFVDDEPKILNAFRRQLMGAPFFAETAEGPVEGLKKAAENGPFAVVVSDLRMPEMDGIQFLSRVRELSAETVRIMLTGYADLQNAIEAVNRGNVFRFLTKPCQPEDLKTAVNDGIRQYQLVTAEKELLEKTLKGSIELLTDLLNMANPEAMGRTSRIRDYVMRIADHIGMPNTWDLETAVMLSQIGCAVMPEDTLHKVYQRMKLTDREKQLFITHPRIGGDLLSHIPRLEKVIRIITYQNKNFNGSGFPTDDAVGADLPLEARMLKVALDFDLFESGGMDEKECFRRMRERDGWYDPFLLEQFEEMMLGPARPEQRPLPKKYIDMEMKVAALEPGMVLAAPIRSGERLIIAKGQKLTEAYIKRLGFYLQNEFIREPVLIRVKAD